MSLGSPEVIVVMGGPEVFEHYLTIFGFLLHNSNEEITAAPAHP